VSGRPKGPNAAARRRIKRNLAARDGAWCFYCGHVFADLASATLDHLVPYSQMPTWRQANLVLACEPCNAAKADQLPQAFLRPSGYGPGLVRTPVPTPVRTSAVPAARTMTADRTARAAPGVRVLPARLAARVRRTVRQRMAAHAASVAPHATAEDRAGVVA